MPYGVTLTNVTAGAHSFSARATDNLGATGTSASVNVTVDAPPTVTLTSPGNNAIFAEGASVTLTASATDAVGNVSKVDFYQGTTLIGTATAAPYTFSWMSVPAGNYSLTAVATNDGGGTTTSAPIAIKVDSPPSVTLDSPANNAVFATTATISLSATPNDTVGTITRVDFYQGTTLLGTATSSPFTFNWTGLIPGTYALTAVATNDAGMSATSSTVSITVDAAPSVSISSPADGSSFTAPATVNLAVTTADTTGTVTQVDYYQNGTLIGSSTAAPFTFNWTNVAAGTYSLTAVATNDSGETTASAPISITVRSAVATVYYIETDHLNTPRLIEDQNGNAVWRNDNTEPFGDSVPNADPNNTGTAFDFPLRFPGQYFDRETGRAYNYFRDYDPTIGRYSISDPAGLNAGLNTYAYVADNPIERFDSNGLMYCQWYGPVLICQGGAQPPGASPSPIDPTKPAANDSSGWMNCPKPQCFRVRVEDIVSYTGTDGTSVKLSRCWYYCNESKRYRYLDVNPLAVFFRCPGKRDEDQGWSGDGFGKASPYGS